MGRIIKNIIKTVILQKVVVKCKYLLHLSKYPVGVATNEHWIFHYFGSCSLLLILFSN